LVLRKRLTALFAASLLSFVCGPICAAEPPRAKVLIWSESAPDQGLVERVRGQVSDLELDLVPLEQEPSEDADTGAVRVWFTRPNSERDLVVVHAARGTQGRPWLREIGDGALTAPGAGLSSATQEAAALVVREALRDMTRVEPAAPLSRAEPKPPPTPAAVVAAPRSALEKPKRSALSFRAELRWEGVEDGGALLSRHGPAVLLGAAYGSLELALFAGSSLQATEEDEHGKVRLLRRAFGLRGGREWILSRAFRLDLGLRAGLVLYPRSALALAPSVVPMADRVSVSSLFGPELRLGCAPRSWPIELILAGGLDVVPGAPRVGYQVGGRFEPSFAVWRLQPSVGVGAAFRSNRAR
jgi:hypothetical protein